MKQPEQYASAQLVADMFKMLEALKFRLPVRRFIYALCDDILIDSKILAELPSGVKSSWIKGKT